MIDVDTLSIKTKITLFNKLYEDIAGLGIGGDTELAHINPWEAGLLRSVGGAGTVNRATDLRQYMGGGSSSPPPQQQAQTRQIPEYAPQQVEYIEDIFGKTQELYEQRTEEGFQPFPGQQIAGFVPQEEEAFAGMSALARGPGPSQDFNIARQASIGAGAPITQAEIARQMSPYQQNVTDIAKRQAVEDYQRGPMAALRGAAVDAGGLRGSRRFIEEAEGRRNLGRRLDDLQATGLQNSFLNAQTQAAQERGRLAGMASQLPGIGTAQYQQQFGQLGQLGGVGEAYRGQEQAALDLARNQFKQEQMFPEETLATYLRFITNAPSPSGFQQTTSAPGVRGPSALTQSAGLLGGLGTLAGGLGGAKGFFAEGGRVPAVSGPYSGLSGTVRRNSGGQVVRMAGGSAYPKSQIGLTLTPFDRAVRDPSYGAGSPLQDMARLYVDLVKAGYTERAERIKDQGENLPRKQYAANLPAQGLSPTGIELKGSEDPFAKRRWLGIRNPPEAADAGIGLSLIPTRTDLGLTELIDGPVAPPKPDPALAPAAAPDTAKPAPAAAEPDDSMTWAERLQIAATLMGAGNTGSTGSFLGDLSQFGADTAGGVGKTLDKKNRRLTAADDKKAKKATDAALFDLKERQVRATETVAASKWLDVVSNSRATYQPLSKGDIAAATLAIKVAGGPSDPSDDAVGLIAQYARENDIPAGRAYEILIGTGRISVDKGWLFGDELVLNPNPAPRAGVPFKVQTP